MTNTRPRLKAKMMKHETMDQNSSKGLRHYFAPDSITHPLHLDALQKEMMNFVVVQIDSNHKRRRQHHLGFDN